MYIKDTYTGNVRKYGTDMHDSLRISNDGTCLTYHHLQCGDGSIEGDKEHSGFLFCDDEGHTPEEDEVLCRNGADAFFNIGGWKEPVIDKARAEIEKLQTYKMFIGEKTVYVERDDVLAIIDKHRGESGE
jgi:hypothetical protein